MTFRLLSESQNKIIEKALEQWNIKSDFTDFAKLQGGGSSFGTEQESAEYWLKNGNTNKAQRQQNTRDIGIRLAIDYDEIKQYILNYKPISKNISEIEFGEYPTSLAPPCIQNMARRFDLEETGKLYHINGRKITDQINPILIRTLIELEYEEKRYICMKPNILKKSIKLNQKEYKNKKNLFVEVLPLKWIVFKNLGIAITKNIIAAGIKFEDVEDYINNYMQPEITFSLCDPFQKDALRQILLIKHQKLMLLNKELKLKRMLTEKSGEDVEKEIDDEYKKRFGVSRKKFEAMLRKIFKDSEMLEENISTLEQLQIALMFKNGLDLEEIENLYAIPKERVESCANQILQIFKK